MRERTNGIKMRERIQLLQQQLLNNNNVSNKKISNNNISRITRDCIHNNSNKSSYNNSGCNSRISYRINRNRPTTTTSFASTSTTTATTTTLSATTTLSHQNCIQTLIHFFSAAQFSRLVFLLESNKRGQTNHNNSNYDSNCDSNNNCSWGCYE